MVEAISPNRRISIASSAIESLVDRQSCSAFPAEIRRHVDDQAFAFLVNWLLLEGRFYSCKSAGVGRLTEYRIINIA
jgi:hypothetical protein